MSSSPDTEGAQDTILRDSPTKYCIFYWIAIKTGTSYTAADGFYI